MILPDNFENLTEAELAQQLVKDGVYDQEAAEAVAAIAKGADHAAPGVD